MNMKKTFAQILEETKSSAAQSLFERAQLANRLAKISSGRQRAYAYHLKDRLIRRAREVSPTDFSLGTDLGCGRWLVRFRRQAGEPGLHWFPLPFPALNGDRFSCLTSSG